MEDEYETYKVIQKNRRLDEIVFEYYGNVELLEKVLEMNIDTLGDAMFLSQGTEIKLPFVVEVVQSKPREIEASTLW
jgi:phage tail protein X